MNTGKNDYSEHHEAHYGGQLSSSNPQFNPALLYSPGQCDEDILEYLKSLGLSFEQNCLVLTSSQHYYYNEEDLMDIRTMVNLKRLNLIRNVDKFLHSLYRILQPGANFVGCFSDSGGSQGWFHAAKPSAILTWFRNFLEMKGEHSISKNQVHELLESHGFRIVDMKEINGLTYFYSLNARKELAKCSGEI